MAQGTFRCDGRALITNRWIVAVAFCVWGALASSIASAANDEFIWARSMGGFLTDEPRSIAVDPNGNVLTTGSFLGTANFDPGVTDTTRVSVGEEDIFIQKRNADGSLAWVRSFGSNLGDFAFGITTDADGYVYTTGYFRGTVNFDPGVTNTTLTVVGDRDMFILKHSPDGDFVWVRRVGGTSTQSGLAIAVDSASNVYVSGLFAGTADFNPSSTETFLRTAVGTFGICALKLNASGNFEWAWTTGGANIDQATGITVDADGNVYTTGFFRGTIDFNPSSSETFNLSSADTRAIFVTKFDTNSGFIWARAMSGTGATQGEGAGIAVDGAGNVYTTGWFNGTTDFDPGPSTFNLATAGGQDIFVSKLNSSGNFVWARGMGGTGADRGASIAVDDAGNVYTTGMYRDTADFDPDSVATFPITSEGSDDIFVSKLDTDGQFVWAHGFGSTAADVGWGIAVDAARGVYVTGRFRSTVDFDPDPVATATLTSAGGDDIFVLKLGDLTPPNATAITPETTGPTNATSVEFDVAFDEAVVNFDDEDDLVISHTGTSHTGITITGGPEVYTVTVEGLSGDGSFTLAVDTTSDVADIAGNPLDSSVTSDAVVIDTVPPGISIGAPSATLTSAGPVTFTVTYTGADSITLAADDVELHTTGDADATIGVSGAGNTRTVTLSGITGDGALSISIDAGTATDAAGNAAPAAGPSDQVTVDNTAPNATAITPASTGPTNAVSIDFTVVFDKPVVNFNNSADLILTHTGTSSTGVSITGGPEVYTATVEGISGNGFFSLTVNTSSDITDLAGNALASSVTSQSVVIDNLPPVIELLGLASMTVEIDGVFNDPGATASDNVDGNLTASIVVTGAVDTSELGVYELFYNVTDTAGNSAVEVVRTVTVVDTTLPVITLLGDASMTVEFGDSFVDPGATASDNVDGNLTASIVVTGSVNTNELGEYELFYNVSDSSGNAAVEVVRTVTVVDTTPPVITLLGNASMTVEFDSVFTDPGATATDNVDGNLTASIVVTGSVNTSELGVYELFYNVSDSSGNAAVQVVRTVTVVDTTPPVITLLGNASMTVEFDSVFTDPGATATDNVDGNLTASIVVTGSVNTSELGVYELFYNVSDSSGNAAVQVVRTVTVVDSVPPVITLLGDASMTVEFDSVFTDPGATATDNVDGDLTASIVVTGSVNTSELGVYELFYNVSDSSGNAAVQVVRTVTVVDTTPPVITLIGNANMSVLIGDSFVDPGATATDNVDGDLTASIVVTGSVNTNELGAYPLSYNVTDSSGNAAVEVVRTVTVVATVPPVITLLGEATLSAEAGEPFVDPGATAIGSEGEDLTADIVVTGAVDTSQLGVYELRYNVADSVGTAADEVVRTVTVADTTPPVITLLGSPAVQVVIGGVFSDPGATATDSFEGSLTAEIVVSGEVDTNTLGVYELLYTVADSSGNEAAVTRTVEVIDFQDFEGDITVVLTGQVLDALTLEPVPCGVVELTASDDSFRVTAVTDANGEYFFEPQPTGVYAIRVLAPGYAPLIPNTIALQEPEDEETVDPIEADFLLTPSVATNRVNGIVTDQNSGYPLVGVLVAFIVDGVAVADTFTCANGRYELPLPAIGGAITIETRFSLPNYIPVEREDTVNAEAGAIIDEALEPEIIGASTIEGIVQAVTGKDTVPLAGARVTLRGPINTSTETDADGLFAFEGILEGSYSVTASATGFGGESRQRGISPGGVGELVFELTPLDEEPPPGIPGDVNGDGVVNAVDVQLVINAALGLTIDPSFDADVNNDGVVNAVDVQLVINAALGIDISGQV